MALTTVIMSITSTICKDSINNGKDTILYVGSDLTAAKMKGNTLYTDKTMTKGFYVDEDAKVVFIQSNDGKKTTEYATGADQVQDFIDDLNADKSGAYKFDISAILDNGVAKTVVIHDQIDSTYKPGEATKPSTSDKVRVTSVDTVNRVVYLNKADAANASDENFNVSPLSTLLCLRLATVDQSCGTYTGLLEGDCC